MIIIACMTYTRMKPAWLREVDKLAGKTNQKKLSKVNTKLPLGHMVFSCIRGWCEPCHFHIARLGASIPAM